VEIDTRGSSLGHSEKPHVPMTAGESERTKVHGNFTNSQARSRSPRTEEPGAPVHLDEAGPSSHKLTRDIVQSASKLLQC
jgi:hypothetical protein